jgi:hypothetical protein
MAKPSGGLKNMNTPKLESLADSKMETRMPVQTEITPELKKASLENFSSPGPMSFSKGDINRFQFTGTSKLKDGNNSLVGASAIYRSPGTVEAAVPSVPEPA